MVSNPTMDACADWLVGQLEAIRATGTEIDVDIPPELSNDIGVIADELIAFWSAH